jgi:hypothetical protein
MGRDLNDDLTDRLVRSGAERGRADPGARTSDEGISSRSFRRPFVPGFAPLARLHNEERSLRTLSQHSHVSPERRIQIEELVRMVRQTNHRAGRQSTRTPFETIVGGRFEPELQSWSIARPCCSQELTTPMRGTMDGQLFNQSSASQPLRSDVVSNSASSY